MPRSVQPAYDDDDMMRMGARLSAYTANFPSGLRPARLFKTEAEARAWLAEQPLE